MAKKHYLSDKNFSVCHAPLPLPYAKFGSRSFLGQLDAPCTQNSEIQVPKDSHLREVFAVLLFRP
jgi:hypothetical protein